MGAMGERPESLRLDMAFPFSLLAADAVRRDDLRLLDGDERRHNSGRITVVRLRP
jgi:hypothetical protein